MSRTQFTRWVCRTCSAHVDQPMVEARPKQPLGWKQYGDDDLCPACVVRVDQFLGINKSVVSGGVYR